MYHRNLLEERFKEEKKISNRYFFHKPSNLAKNVELEDLLSSQIFENMHISSITNDEFKNMNKDERKISGGSK